MGIIQQVGSHRGTVLFGSAIRGISLYDDFSYATPAWWWATGLGTLATNGGALRASAIASDMYNMVSNPELTIDTGSWAAGAGAVISRVDSGVDPGASSGGLDDWCLKVVSTGAAGSQANQMVTPIIGATYASACRAYAPSANTSVNAANLTGIGTGSIAVEDSWATIGGTKVATLSPDFLRFQISGSTIGDTIYGDAFSLYMQSSIGTGNLYIPNAQVVTRMISPAVLTTPRALILRYQNNFNFVRLLLLPNTAGTDTILETVTAGVPATVAGGTADVDWTPGGTDRVYVIVRNNTYTVQHMKAGASVWTTAFTATTASFNAQTRFGVQLFAAADNSFDEVLIESL